MPSEQKLPLWALVGDADGLIAATAIVHDLIVVTRKVTNFNDAGVSVINPWDLA